MAKYSKIRVAQICSLIRKDSYTIAEICSISGIDEATYYRWLKEKSEFCEAVTRAREDFNEARLVECERSLVKLISGYDYEEIKTVMSKNSKGEPTVKERTVTKKHIIPNLPAIIHFQTNRDPENWKNRQTNELTGKGGKDLFEGVSNEELEGRIAELEKKLAD